MLDFIRNLFQSDFMPHGGCYFWRPDVLWLHAISDGLIALSYFLIPFSLIQLVRKRHEFEFNRVFLMFGAFILSCGLTHVMGIWNIWHSTYRLEGLIKAITAAVSIPVAILMFRLVPKVVAFPTHQQLRNEVEERSKAQHAVLTLDAQLKQIMLSDAEQRFRLVVEAAPSAMVMVSTEGRITLVNAQTEKLFQYRREELLGNPVEMLVPLRFRSAHTRDRTNFFSSPTARVMGHGRDIFALCKDGTEIPVEVGLNPVHTFEGRFVLASVTDVTERKAAEQKILNSLQEKEILLKEVHHRVKNNLAVIASLLARQAETAADPLAVSSLEESQRRIQAMALVHEHLYSHENLDRINFADYIRTLANELYGSLLIAPDRVNLRVDAEGIDLAVHRAIPCGLILNELLSNAFKYAFPPEHTGGEVVVAFHSGVPGALILSVQDNGVGIPESYDWRETKSLGLQIVRILAKQVNGSVELERSSGTHFTVTMKG